MSYIKYIFICYTLFIYNSIALAQTRAVDGTILIVDHILSQYIVLGAESRGTLIESGEYKGENDICKIQSLDDHTAFSSSGRFIINHVGEGLLYNAWDSAKNIFIPRVDLNALAERWALTTEVAYYNIYAKGGDVTLKGLKTDSVVTGVFSDTRQFKAIAVTVRNDRNLLGIKFYHTTPRLLEVGKMEGYSTPLGMALFQEFWGTTSGRAKDKQAERRKTIHDRHYEGGVAEAFTVKMGIDTALLWNDGRDREIGGETATLILEKNMPLRWHHESEICHKVWQD
jgi:hypothetical protein